MTIVRVVCDADRDRRRSGSVDRITRSETNAVEDLHGVVLDPTRLRKILRNFAVTAAGDASIFANRLAGRTGCPFVDRRDVFHSAL
jgi:hypothetical protein